MDEKLPTKTNHIRGAFEAVRDTGPAPRNVVEVDFEKYMQFLEDSDLSDDQKKEFLETIYDILLSFVDLGFGIHPMQHVLEEKDQKFIDCEAVKSDNKDNSKASISEELDKAVKITAAERLEI